MTDLTLAAADTIIKAGLAHAREKNMKPLGIVVLDARGAVKTYGAEDGTSLKRYEIAKSGSTEMDILFSGLGCSEAAPWWGFMAKSSL